MRPGNAIGRSQAAHHVTASGGARLPTISTLNSFSAGSCHRSPGNPNGNREDDLRRKNERTERKKKEGRKKQPTGQRGQLTPPLCSLHCVCVCVYVYVCVCVCMCV